MTLKFRKYLPSFVDTSEGREWPKWVEVGDWETLQQLPWVVKWSGDGWTIIREEGHVIAVNHMFGYKSYDRWVIGFIKDD